MASKRRRSGVIALMIGVGVLVVVAAGLVVIAQHAPATRTVTVAMVDGHCPGIPNVVLATDFACPGPAQHTGLSATQYDVSHLVIWMAVLAAAALMTLGLTRVARSRDAV
jgi:hypothetical protein